MQTFTGFEYLLIDAANQYGLDKENFKSRLIWAKTNYDQLELLIPDCPAKTRPAFEKVVQVIRKAAKGEAIGHRVGFDAICSGMQLMSAMTNCLSGATATGLVDPHRRPNAYTEVGDAMSSYLQGEQIVVDAADVKQAVLTTLYGSKAVPKRLFGDPDPDAPATPELKAFYAAVREVAPGASMLMDDLLAVWQPFALKHEWTLPDNHLASVKVMQKVSKRLRVDELNNSSFTYEWYENCGAETGLSLVANVTHSVDAYVLRTLVRRCMYDPLKVDYFYDKCLTELVRRELGGQQETSFNPINKETKVLMTRFMETQLPDILIFDYIKGNELCLLDEHHISGLLRIMFEMRKHSPFEIICVHDEFTAHPNNVNELRNHYRHILADLAESTILSDIFSQITGTDINYQKLGHPDVADKIRGSNYALS